MAVFLNDSILADTSAELPERKRLSKKHDRGRNDKGNPSGGGKLAEAKQPEGQKTETASPSNTGDKKWVNHFSYGIGGIPGNFR